MNIYNFLKEINALYAQPKNLVSLVDVPALNFLFIDGFGSPNNNPEYSSALEALYSVAYTIKFAFKKSANPVDFKVMPLEGLWWADNMEEFSLDNRENWQWRMMLMQPDIVTGDLASEMVDNVKKKKKIARINDIHYEKFHEGQAAQILHLGPYGEAERPAVEKLHQWIKEKGYKLSGKHHEIYFNSPLRTAPEKLKTIIRQPYSNA